MRKILATMTKEWQLTRRDISGLILLLAMPAILIVVMALVQDAPFRDYRNLRFDLLLADNDHGSLARQITLGLKQSGNFHVVDSLNNAPVDEATLKRELNEGNYKIGVIIPQGITAEIANSANIAANDISRKMGMEASLPTRPSGEKMFVQVCFDPVSKPAFRTAINSAIEKYITYSSTSALMQRLSTMNHSDSANGDNEAADLKKIMEGIGVKEQPLNDSVQYYSQHVNSVQHNVPAWAIFGMFFIAIPMTSHILRERMDGSALRVALIPFADKFVVLGKIFFYTLLCLLQFGVMLAIGVWGMPYFGMPSLYTGAHASLLLPVALCISFTATSYGYLTGAVFKTFTQALPFSSVSIVMLSAIGGIWVPVEVLPHGMQQLARLSPLHWSLDAINRVIIRDGDWASILHPCLILVLTGIVLFTISILVNNSRGRSLQ
jgi:ABC-2 type transport system permease protein